MPVAVAVVAVVVSAASAAYSAYQQSEMQDKQDEALAKQAEQARQATAIQAAQEREAGAYRAAAQRAQSAAAGIALDEAGSTADVIGKNIVAKTEKNVELINIQGGWQQENISMQREINRVKDPLVSGIFQGAAGVASGVAGIYGASQKSGSTDWNPLVSNQSTSATGSFYTSNTGAKTSASLDWR